MPKLPNGARLRIAKSSLSKRSFSFQKTIDLREENAILHGQYRVHARRVKRRHSSTISSTRTDSEAATLIGKDAFARVFESLGFGQTFGKPLGALG